MTTPLEERIKSSLNDSLQQLDGETSLRLQAIRHEALNQPAKQHWLSNVKSHYWVPATGLIFCSIIASILLLPSLSSNNQQDALSQTAMLELLESADDLEIIADPEFYLWMDELDTQKVSG